MQSKNWPRGAQGHDVSQLYNILNLDLGLNTDYLKLLSKAYSLRYPDDLIPGFNLSLNDTKMLVELDSSVFEVRKGFKITENGKNVETEFDGLLKSESKEIMENNCFFGTVRRADIFSRPSFSYAIRLMGNGGFLEIAYQTEDDVDSSLFNVEALVPGKQGSGATSTA